MQSILTTIKKMLGIAYEYEVYDVDITALINSTFLILKQLGVGPKEGFFITDSSQIWEDFLPSGPLLESVKSYIYMKVRLVFDPPSSSYVVTAYENQIKEFEWRANVESDRGCKNVQSSGC